MTRAESLFNLARRLGATPASLRPVAAVLLAVAVCAALGLALPLGSLPAATGPGVSTMGTAPGGPADAEALDGFLAMTRWGSSAVTTPGSDDESAGSKTQSGLNPELARLGVIGITGAVDNRAVLLTRPDGTTDRLLDGDALPDGRILVAVTGNAVTLLSADGGREQLLLFPRLDDAAMPDEPPAQGEAAP